MRVETIVSGMLQNNTYVLTDEKTGESAVIDPAAHNSELFKLLEEKACKLKFIIATHGHYDHVTDMAALKERFGGLTVIHQADVHMLGDSRALGGGKPLTPDMLLTGGERLELGQSALEIYHTPGHTKGGICVRCGELLFTGDTLFHDDVGRTDLSGGDEKELRNSLKNVLGSIKEDLKVLPGHEEASSLAYEKKNNPFFW